MAGTWWVVGVIAFCWMNLDSALAQQNPVPPTIAPGSVPQVPPPGGAGGTITNIQADLNRRRPAGVPTPPQPIDRGSAPNAEPGASRSLQIGGMTFENPQLSLDQTILTIVHRGGRLSMNVGALKASEKAAVEKLRPGLLAHLDPPRETPAARPSTTGPIIQSYTPPAGVNYSINPPAPKPLITTPATAHLEKKLPINPQYGPEPSWAMAAAEQEIAKNPISRINYLRVAPMVIKQEGLFIYHNFRQRIFALNILPKSDGTETKETPSVDSTPTKPIAIFPFAGDTLRDAVLAIQGSNVCITHQDGELTLRLEDLSADKRKYLTSILPQLANHPLFRPPPTAPTRTVTIRGAQVTGRIAYCRQDGSLILQTDSGLVACQLAELSEQDRNTLNVSETLLAKVLKLVKDSDEDVQRVAMNEVWAKSIAQVKAQVEYEKQQALAREEFMKQFKPKGPNGQYTQAQQLEIFFASLAEADARLRVAQGKSPRPSMKEVMEEVDEMMVLNRQAEADRMEQLQRDTQRQLNRKAGMPF